MALTATFRADFDQFERSIQSATVKLQVFDRATKNATRDLTRELNAFSGQKVAVEAGRMAEAIQRIGGVSKLTEAELRRVTGVVAEATAKFRALGVEVPPSIAKLHAEIGTLGAKTQAAVAPVNGLAGALTRLGPLASALGISFGAFAVVNFGKQILKDADAVQKLADKTGIGVEALQKLQYAAEQSGNTLEQVTSAVSQMQNRLAEGDKSAVGALRALGLSFEQLRTLSPDQQFMAIAREVAAIENPMERTRIAMDLFGRSGAEILPTLRADMKKLGDEAPVMSEKAVAAFDAIGDAASRNWTRAKNAIGEGVAAAIDGYSRLFDVSRALMSGDFGRVPEVLLDLGSKAPTIAAPVNSMLASVADNAKGVALSMDEINDVSRTLDGSFKRNARSAQDFSKELDKASKEQRDFNNWIGERYIAAEALRQEAAAKSESQLRTFYNWLGERRMEDDRALMESTRILATYTAAWAPLKAAVEQTLPKMEDASQKTKRLADAQQEAATSLRTLAQGFATLAQVAGDTGLGKFLTQIGQIVGAMALAKDASQAFTKGLDAFKGGSYTAGLSQMAAGVLSVVAAMEQATRGTNKWMSALGGFSAGAQVGGIWGGIIGAFIGYLRGSENAHRAAMEAARLYRKELGDLRKAAVDLMDVANLLGMGKGLRDMLDAAETVEDLERIRKELERIGQEASKTADEVGDILDQISDAGFTIPADLEMFFLEFERLLDPANKKKLQDLLGVLGTEEVNWRKMQQIAEKFGIDINSLGKAFQAAKFKDSAKDIIDAWQLLTRNNPGAQGGVLFGMKDEIQQLVNDAKKFGLDIPEQFRPLIQNLIDTKQLFDENGDAITDIGQIKFGPPLVSEMDKIMKKIDELIDKFLDLFNAIAKVPKLPSDIIPEPGTVVPPDPSRLPTPPGGNTGQGAVGGRLSSALFAHPGVRGGGGDFILVGVVVTRDQDPDALTTQVVTRLPQHIAGNESGIKTFFQGLIEQAQGTAR